MINRRRQLLGNLLLAGSAFAANALLRSVYAASERDEVRWRSPEVLVQYGFVHSRVVMMNEAHAFPKRCIRTRKIGESAVRAAHEVGVRHLAMEALYPHAIADQANKSRAAPTTNEGFLAQPEMHALIQTALDLGWTLVAYEADLQRLPQQMSDAERANWREDQQAHNLADMLNKLPPMTKLLAWCGNSHHSEIKMGSWTPMGYLFRSLTGIDPFTIDQSISVEFAGLSPAFKGLVEEFRSELEEQGGTAGFLREDAPAPLRGRGDIDAFILSTQNTLE